MKIFAFAAASATVFASTHAKTFFSEDFNSGDLSNWVTPERENLGEFKLSAGKFFADEKNVGLQTSQDARFYGIASKFAEPFDNTDDTLVVQLSVKHEQSIDCGGGYVKVYGPDADLTTLDGDSPYEIMFGPDICGSKKMVHVIFTKNGENFLIKKTIKAPTDVFSHVFTLIVSPDNTYQVLVDNEELASGSLSDDWDILPPKMIKDPKVSKPEDWVEDKLIDDETDFKPEGYDDITSMIADPEATEPEDWDEDMDGEWEIPMVPNPEYRGPWMARKIDNPDYKGPWEHPMVENPEYNDDPNLYKFNMGAVGVDVWQVLSGSIFDDILVTNDTEEAKAQADEIVSRQEQEKELKAEADEETRLANEKLAVEMEDFEDEDDDELEYEDSESAEDDHDEL